MLLLPLRLQLSDLLQPFLQHDPLSQLIEPLLHAGLPQIGQFGPEIAMEWELLPAGLPERGPGGGGAGL